ncbi:MAG: anion permease [Chloroflexota bacterium]|nr:anion permease [Chloroflexota bacterium]
MDKKALQKALIVVAVGIVLAIIPVPAGLQPNAWYYFALFAAAILGLILEPIPTAAVGLVAVTLAMVLCLVTPGKPKDSIAWMLAGFANTTVWLIFTAYMFAKGYEKSGLGRRIALVLVKLLGKRTLGLGYAIALADLVVAPGTPSNTARSGGTIYPILENIPPLYGSKPNDPSARKIGSYLMWTALAITCVTSSMFLTALAPNPLALDLVNKATKLTFTWTDWMVGFLPVGVVLFLLVPLLVYKIYPPEIKVSPEVPVWAGKELGLMGPISRNEIVMGILVILALGLWIFAADYIDTTAVALLVLSLMILTNVLNWEDVITNKNAWNVLVWFATLVTLADGLNKVGFLTWFAKGASAALTGIPVVPMMVLFVALFFFIHYMFASLTAHTTALLPVILAAAIVVPGMPVKPLVLLLCYTLGLMGILTPYATGPSPIYYGSGYITRKDFWVLGLVFGAIFLAVLLIIGVPYLMMLYPS